MHRKFLAVVLIGGASVLASVPSFADGTSFVSQTKNDALVGAPTAPSAPVVISNENTFGAGRTSAAAPNASFGAMRPGSQEAAPGDAGTFSAGFSAGAGEQPQTFATQAAPRVPISPVVIDDGAVTGAQTFSAQVTPSSPTPGFKLGR